MISVLNRFSACFFYRLALTAFTLIPETKLLPCILLEDDKLTNLLLIVVQLFSLLLSQPLEEHLKPYLPSFCCHNLVNFVIHNPYIFMVLCLILEKYTLIDGLSFFSLVLGMAGN